jgi:hypothetical protein
MTRKAEIYQKGGSGKYQKRANSDSTYCNLATFDVAEATGFNTSALYDGKNRDEINANAATQNLAKAAGQGIVTEVSAGRAQALANAGYTVIAAWENTAKDENGNTLRGHLATVCPNSLFNTTISNNIEPKISNVGENNGIMSVSGAFGVGKTPQYYYDPNQTFVFDTSNILKTNAKPKKNK